VEAKNVMGGMAAASVGRRTMRITKLLFSKFAPFGTGQIVFPYKSNSKLAEVHFLTGENGTGKTRLLNLISASMWPANRYTESELNKKWVRQEGDMACVFFGIEDSSLKFWFTRNNSETFGVDSERANLNMEVIMRNINNYNSNGGTIDVNNPNSKNKMAAMSFRGTAALSTADVPSLTQLSSKDMGICLDFHSSAKASGIVSQTIANIKIRSALEAINQMPDDERRFTKIAIKLENAIRKIAGNSFVFSVSAIGNNARVIVSWRNIYNLEIDYLPDGLKAIINWIVLCISRLIAIYGASEDIFAVPLILLFDEPELHLHPKWQRQLILSAQQLFPNSQMFIATHSPFIISSVNEGWIHVFRCNDNGSTRIDNTIPCSPGDTWIDVVEDVLGVHEWYDPETENLLVKFRYARDLFGSGDATLEKVQTLANQIANRSEALKAMMSREMKQIYSAMERRESTK
jgi:predicted ATP-binding protein involved in virulence